MRGLKLHVERYHLNQVIVASFTDAWIETEKAIAVFGDTKVASFTDAWIETRYYTIGKLLGKSHLLQMRGLKLYFL